MASLNILGLPYYSVPDDAWQDTVNLGGRTLLTGDDFFQIGTEGAYWDYYQTIYVLVGTIGVGGPRELVLRLRDQNTKIIAESPMFATQAAGTACKYTWTDAISTAYSITSTLTNQVAPLFSLFVQPGWKLEIVCQNSAFSDSFSDIAATRIRFPTGPGLPGNATDTPPISPNALALI